MLPGGQGAGLDIREEWHIRKKLAGFGGALDGGIGPAGAHEEQHEVALPGYIVLVDDERLLDPGEGFLVVSTIFVDLVELRR